MGKHIDYSKQLSNLKVDELDVTKVEFDHGGHLKRIEGNIISGEEYHPFLFFHDLLKIPHKEELNISSKETEILKDDICFYCRELLNTKSKLEMFLANPKLISALSIIVGLLFAIAILK